MNKPLTNIDREVVKLLRNLLEETYVREIDSVIDGPERVIDNLLSAEAFWRDAVKNAQQFDRYSGDCNFCGDPEHKPDCPWLLAQEES